MKKTKVLLKEKIKRRSHDFFNSSNSEIIKSHKRVLEVEKKENNKISFNEYKKHNQNIGEKLKDLIDIFYYSTRFREPNRSSKNILESIIYETLEKSREIVLESNRVKLESYTETLLEYLLEAKKFKVIYENPRNEMEELINKTVLDLQEKKEINTINRTHYMNLEEFLEEKEIKNRDIMMIHLSNGNTLEETARLYGVTRERVRQILKGIYIKIRMCGGVKEEKYIHLMQYDFTAEIFSKIFNKKEYVYNYLKYINDHENKTRATKSKRNLVELLEEGILSESQEEVLKEILSNEYIFFDENKILKKEIGEILDYLIAQIGEQFTIEEFLNKYTKFINNYGIILNTSIKNIRNLEGLLLRRKNIISSFGKKYRYYEYSEETVDFFYEELDFDSYNNLVISTLKIFEDNKTLMELTDIKNEYELHNFLKKTNRIDNIKYNKMPMIEIGESNYFNQIKLLMIQYSGISKYEFSKIVESEYGIRQETFLGSMQEEIKKYIVDDKIKIVGKKLSEENIIKIKSSLTENFYNKDEIVKYLKVLGIDYEELLFHENIAALGFTVTNSYIFTKKINNISDYLEDILLENNFCNLSSVKKKVPRGSGFEAVFYKLRQRYKLLKINENKYLKIEYLNQFGVTEETIIDFLKKISKTDIKYYNTFLLKNKNFNHEIFNLGYDDYFYDEIIKVSKKKEYILLNNNNVIFVNEIEKGVDYFKEFVKEKLEGKAFINIYDLIEKFEKKFGFKDLKEAKIIEKIRKSGFYYTGITGNIYKDIYEYKERIMKLQGDE